MSITIKNAVFYHPYKSVFNLRWNIKLSRVHHYSFLSIKRIQLSFPVGALGFWAGNSIVMDKTGVDIHSHIVQGILFLKFDFSAALTLAYRLYRFYTLKKLDLKTAK